MPVPVGRGGEDGWDDTAGIAPVRASEGIVFRLELDFMDWKKYMMVPRLDGDLGGKGAGCGVSGFVVVLGADCVLCGASPTRRFFWAGSTSRSDKLLLLYVLSGRLVVGFGCATIVSALGVESVFIDRASLDMRCQCGSMGKCWVRY